MSIRGAITYKQWIKIVQRTKMKGIAGCRRKAQMPGNKIYNARSHTLCVCHFYLLFVVAWFRFVSTTRCHCSFTTYIREMNYVRFGDTERNHENHNKGICNCILKYYGNTSHSFTRSPSALRSSRVSLLPICAQVNLIESAEMTTGTQNV